MQMHMKCLQQGSTDTAQQLPSPSDFSEDGILPASKKLVETGWAKGLVTDSASQDGTVGAGAVKGGKGAPPPPGLGKGGKGAPPPPGPGKGAGAKGGPKGGPKGGAGKAANGED